MLRATDWRRPERSAFSGSGAWIISFSLRESGDDLSSMATVMVMRVGSEVEEGERSRG